MKLIGIISYCDIRNFSPTTTYVYFCGISDYTKSHVYISLDYQKTY